MDTGPAPAAASVLDLRLSGSLTRLRDASLYRSRRVIEGRHGVQVRVDGRDCLSFCSNDYLGLASDPRLARAATRALDQVGTGSGASALISGYNREHRRLEEALAIHTGYPRVLLFSSGWAANLGVLRALLGREDVLIADELNHASLIDGGRLSGATYRRVPHADLPGFSAALTDSRCPMPDSRLRLVVTDSVFSMDGDLAPLPGLSALCREHHAALMIDDAHGLGVLGATGRGAAEHFGVRPDIYVATLGKSLGSSGAFVAGSDPLIEYLIQRARSFVFSTAPPPAIAAAAREALRIIDAEPERRARLHHNIRRFIVGASSIGLAIGAGIAQTDDALTPIQPLIIGDEARTMAISRALFERGWWVAGIRPPTVPRGTARLRITLSAAHTDAQIDGLIEALHACMTASS
ncbi:MAG: 8-amino-7-oxononanoate synthase [Panacagrimonas sp.]